MLIRYSIKQMLRTPVKTLMLFLLLLLSTGLLTTGINLWQTSRKGIQEFKALFHTIGLVQQKEDTTKVVRRWNAATKEFSYYRSKTFSTWIDAAVLDLEGVNYIAGPRKRPYFGAYLPNVQKYTGEKAQSISMSDWMIVVEVKALSSGTANPIKVEVTKKFCGSEEMTGEKIWICDHYNPNPVTIEAGKTYIVSLNGPLGDHKWQLTQEDRPESYEYFITNIIVSTQCSIDGEPKEDEEETNAGIAEVTPGFYETAQGKAWMEAAKTQEVYNATVPVQPVDKTILLKAFFDKSAYIKEGRDITNTEYETGKHVCLVPDTMAEYNHWSIGDTLELPLYFANYANTPLMNWRLQGEGFSFSLLSNEKKMYQVFERDTYTIVGFYSMKNVIDNEEDGLSNVEIIIPYLSVTNSWDNNILDSQPMKASTTSFEIPNGTIDEYMEQLHKEGIKNLDIQFYDKGYTKLEAGIQNRKVMGYILLAGGVIITLLILLFFCHLFITKQKERTAVERCIGVSRGKCAISLLSGLLLIVLLGVLAGGVIGYQVSDRVTAGGSTETYYDETYTNGYIEKTSEEELLKEVSKNREELGKGAIAAAVLVITASGVIAGSYMGKSLKNEPLYLLSRAEN